VKLVPSKLRERVIAARLSDWPRILPTKHRATPAGAGFGSSRYSSPSNAFRVLYAADNFPTAFAEAVDPWNGSGATTYTATTHLGRRPERRRCRGHGRDGGEVPRGRWGGLRLGDGAGAIGTLPPPRYIQVMASLNVDLNETLDRFVEDRVVSGEFQNASEVVSAGLRLLKARADRRQARLERLGALIQEGLDDLDAGRYEDVDDISAWLDRRGRAPGA